MILQDKPKRFAPRHTLQFSKLHRNCIQLDLTNIRIKPNLLLQRVDAPTNQISRLVAWLTQGLTYLTANGYHC